MSKSKKNEFMASLIAAIRRYRGDKVADDAIKAIIYIMGDLIDNPNFTITINNTIVTSSLDIPIAKRGRSVHIKFEDRLPIDDDVK